MTNMYVLNINYATGIYICYLYTALIIKSHSTYFQYFRYLSLILLFDFIFIFNSFFGLFFSQIVHLLTKQLNWIVYIYTFLTMITIIFHVKLSKIQVKGWMLTVKQYFLNKLSITNTYYSSNEATKIN